LWVGDPSQASGGDAGDPERNFVALAQFVLAVAEELDERPVDVSESEEAQVVGMNRRPLAAK
jgi:hypothetical protein